MTNPDTTSDAAIEGVLFDLDGTLVDTAPDMVDALIRLQRMHGAAALAYELVRSNVSNGAAGLVRLAFPDADDELHTALHGSYLQLYQDVLCERSRVFPGLDRLLDELDEKRRPWGVVTNKPQRLTEPLLGKLGLLERVACAISGDTLPQRKPHPAPMLLASRLMNVAPGSILYVGDAARDIEAGHAAGMTTIAAGYGYITADDDPQRWSADAIAASPEDLRRLVRAAVRLDS
ncbi:MAG TPA: HAD-IA family hydrolase [Woeseiaceae bacterium]|nr:HAD-IA family hydrolase [Woeseiaceae bacterium]